MMCTERFVFTWSMIDASVVDLPDPVGPVTSTRPRGRSASGATTGGRPRSSSSRISIGMARRTAPTASRWRNTLTRKRARRPVWLVSSSRSRSNATRWRSSSSSYTSRRVSPRPSTPYSGSGTRRPSTRMLGAAPTVKCRSLAPSASTRSSRSSIWMRSGTALRPWRTVDTRIDTPNDRRSSSSSTSAPSRTTAFSSSLSPSMSSSSTATWSTASSPASRSQYSSSSSSSASSSSTTGGGSRPVTNATASIRSRRPTNPESISRRGSGMPSDSYSTSHATPRFAALYSEALP